MDFLCKSVSKAFPSLSILMLLFWGVLQNKTGSCSSTHAWLVAKMVFFSKPSSKSGRFGEELRELEKLEESWVHPTRNRAFLGLFFRFL